LKAGRREEMKSIGTETKVGIFVLLGIVLLILFTVRVGRISVREEGYRTYSYVESAAGLDKNSPVRIAGVEVGKVEGIKLEGLKAKVTMLLPFSVKLPLGSKVYVKSAGLLGEKYIEIVPGTGGEIIKANGQIEEGGPSADVDRVLTQLSTVGGDIQRITRSLSNVLGGPEGEKSIREMVDGAKETMANLQQITETVNRGEGTLGKLVKDDKLYTEVKDTMANLREVTQSIEEGKGTLGRLVKDEALYVETKETMIEAKETLANLNKVSKQIESGEGTLGKLVKDEALYNETKATMTEAKEALASLKKVSDHIEKGEGTLGKLVMDDSLFNDAKATMTEAKETMANLKKVSEQIEKGEGTLGKLTKDEALYDDTRRAVKSVQKAADGISEVTPVTVLSIVLGTVLR
jgi:phospholipid/cholesterol/gamma-HCH transport system substrate-binding protein